MSAPVTVGFVVSDGGARELAEGLADELPGDLRERVGDADWRVEVVQVEAAEPSVQSADLERTVRDRVLSEGWDLGIGLTTLPLRSGRRPVTAHASATWGVGLLSLPALGAVHIERRLKQAVVHLVEGLLGEAVAREGGRDGPQRQGRIAARLAELRSPLG